MRFLISLICSCETGVCRSFRDDDQKIDKRAENQLDKQVDKQARQACQQAAR